MNEKKLEDSVRRAETGGAPHQRHCYNKVVKAALLVSGVVPVRDEQDVLQQDFIVDDFCPADYPVVQFELKAEPPLNLNPNGLFFGQEEKDKFFVPRKIGKADPKAKGSFHRRVVVVEKEF